jgi:hypothetical protein
VLRSRLQAGARIKATKLTEMFGPEDYAAKYPNPAMALFVATQDRKLEFVTADQPPQLRSGATVLTLVPQELARTQEQAEQVEAQ